MVAYSMRSCRLQIHTELYCLRALCLLRDMVRQKKITMEEGTLMRTLLFMPGGLELHIGVSLSAICMHFAGFKKCKTTPASLCRCQLCAQNVSNAFG